MKTKLLKLFGVFAALFASCTSDSTSDPLYLESLALDMTTNTIATGKAFVLAVTPQPATLSNLDYEWTWAVDENGDGSFDGETIYDAARAEELVEAEKKSPDFVTFKVLDGVVDTGNTPLEAVIYCSVKGSSVAAAECFVKVIDGRYATTEIVVSPTSFSLDLETYTTKQVEVLFTPDFDSDDDDDTVNPKVIYDSYDTNVFTVDEDGLVTAVGVGSAILKATAYGCGVEAMCQVTVTESYVEVTGAEITGASTIPAIMRPGDSYTLSAAVLPSEASQSVVWSLDGDYASVDGEPYASIDATTGLFRVLNALPVGSHDVIVKATPIHADGSLVDVAATITLKLEREAGAYYIRDYYPEFDNAATAIGVVYIVDKVNSSKGMVVSLAKSEEVMWCDESIYDVRIESGSATGALNMAALATKYPQYVVTSDDGSIDYSLFPPFDFCNKLTMKHNAAGYNDIYWYPPCTLENQALYRVWNRSTLTGGVYNDTARKEDQMEFNAIVTEAAEAQPSEGDISAIRLDTRYWQSNVMSTNESNTEEENNSTATAFTYNELITTNNNLRRFKNLKYPTLAISCFGGYVANESSPTSIELNFSNVILPKGASLTLLPTFYPAGTFDECILSSSDPSVVSYGTNYLEFCCDNIGTSILTVTCAGAPSVVAECRVEVVSADDYTAVEKLYFDTESYAVDYPGLTQQLVIDLEPSKAAEFAELTYLSSDNEIATVDAEGMVTAHMPGEVTITAVCPTTAEDNAENNIKDGVITATCNVVVGRQAGHYYVGDYYPDATDPTTAVGVIYSVTGENADKGLIVSLDEAVGAWDSGDNLVSCAATSSAAGSNNTMMVRANDPTFANRPIFDWCDNVLARSEKSAKCPEIQWYIPALTELENLYNTWAVASDKYNAKIELAGGVPISLVSYGSSKEGINDVAGAFMGYDFSNDVKMESVKGTIMNYRPIAFFGYTIVKAEGIESLSCDGELIAEDGALDDDSNPIDNTIYLDTSLINDSCELGVNYTYNNPVEDGTISNTYLYGESGAFKTGFVANYVIAHPFKWSSSNPALVEVDELTGEVQVKGITGDTNVTITASLIYDPLVAKSCEVNVVEGPNLPENFGLVYGESSTALNEGDVVPMNTGDVINVSLTYESNEVATQGVWSSDDTSVATVIDGVITAVRGGSANITVTAPCIDNTDPEDPKAIDRSITFALDVTKIDGYYVVGDLYPNAESPVGVVSAIKGGAQGGTAGTIISLDEVMSQWCVAESPYATATSGAIGTAVGVNYTALILKNLDALIATDFPAFEWLEAKNDAESEDLRWFIPSSGELAAIAGNVVALNEVLSAGGYAPIQYATYGASGEPSTDVTMVKCVTYSEKGQATANMAKSTEALFRPFATFGYEKSAVAGIAFNTSSLAMKYGTTANISAIYTYDITATNTENTYPSGTNYNPLYVAYYQKESEPITFVSDAGATVSDQYSFGVRSYATVTAGSEEASPTITATSTLLDGVAATMAVTVSNSVLEEGETLPDAGDGTYKIGSYYPDSENPIGVVIAVGEDGTYGTIMSLTYNDVKANPLVWSTENVATGATSTEDGAANMDAVLAHDEDLSEYPAFKWCNDFNSDPSTMHDDVRWYLPAFAEMMATYNNVILDATNKLYVESALKKYGDIGFIADNFLTSTETSASTYNRVHMGKGGSASGRTKGDKHMIRAYGQFGEAPSVTEPTVTPIVPADDTDYIIGAYYPDATNAETAIGIVVSAVAEGKVTIMSLDEASLAWSVENVATGAVSNSLDADNYAALIAVDPTLEKYPAAQWCYTYSAGDGVNVDKAGAEIAWYLPAQNNLKIPAAAIKALANDEGFNARLTGVTTLKVGAAMDLATGIYWCSMEGGSDTAKVVKVGEDKVGALAKSEQHSVRAFASVAVAEILE